MAILLAEQKLFSLPDIVARTGISSRSWRRFIQRGEIGVLRLGGRVLIPADELEAFLQKSFTPPIGRRPLAPAAIEEIIDKVAPRRRAGGAR
jgi:excisionase family DNA binding protein